MVYRIYWQKKTKKSNIPKAPGPAEDIEPELLENEENCSSDENDKDCGKEYISLKGANSSSKKSSPSDAGKQSSRSGSQRMANIDVLKEITAFLKFKRNKSTPVDSADSLFGRMVATELKQIPEERKRVIKQEITTILYRHQTSTYSGTSESLPVQE